MASANVKINTFVVNDLASPSAIPPAENIIGEIYCMSCFVKGSLKVVRAIV